MHAWVLPTLNGRLPCQHEAHFASSACGVAAATLEQAQAGASLTWHQRDLVVQVAGIHDRVRHALVGQATTEDEVRLPHAPVACVRNEGTPPLREETA